MILRGVIAPLWMVPVRALRKNLTTDIWFKIPGKVF